MLHFLAQTTQPSSSYERWILIAAGVVTLATMYLIPKLVQMVGELKKLKEAVQDLFRKSDTNQQNIQTVAKVSDGVIQAQRQSPGPNVPISATLAVRAISQDPTTAAELPRDVSPVEAPRTPTPEATQRAFDAAEGKDVT
jgi:hypothetical protein